MLAIIDQIANRYLDWRTARKAAELAGEYELKHARFDAERMEICVKAPVIVDTFYVEAAALLEGCQNYFEFDLFPRGADRPIRVTVQWADGESPAKKAARLQKRIDELEATASGDAADRQGQAARIAELEDDAARLDGAERILKEGGWPRISFDGATICAVSSSYQPEAPYEIVRDTLREAIDAAIKESESSL